jgi:hypothetical protein
MNYGLNPGGGKQTVKEHRRAACSTRMRKDTGREPTSRGRYEGQAARATTAGRTVDCGGIARGNCRRQGFVRAKVAQLCPFTGEKAPPIRFCETNPPERVFRPSNDRNWAI